MEKILLTDEQVENWRRVLLGMFGTYALLMTREQIQEYRDKMQEDFAKVEDDEVTSSTNRNPFKENGR